jgi:hypothetical protein
VFLGNQGFSSPQYEFCVVASKWDRSCGPTQVFFLAYDDYDLLTFEREKEEGDDAVCLPAWGIIVYLVVTT